MTTRTSTNYWLNLVSFIVMVGLAATGGLIHFVLPPGTGHWQTLFGLGRHDFGQVHFYLAVAAVLMLALHILLHWSWLCCVTAKKLGRRAPSRHAQTLSGLFLLFGVALLLGGSLFLASRMVERTATAKNGRTHGNDRPRAVRHGVLRNTVEATIPPHRTGPAHTGRKSTHEKHLEDCPTGASINGRTSFEDAARICRLDVQQMRQYLALPGDIDENEQLGRLKRRFGFHIHDVRKLACR